MSATKASRYNWGGRGSLPRFLVSPAEPVACPSGFRRRETDTRARSWLVISTTAPFGKRRWTPSTPSTPFAKPCSDFPAHAIDISHRVLLLPSRWQGLIPADYAEQRQKAFDAIGVANKDLAALLAEDRFVEPLAGVWPPLPRGNSQPDSRTRWSAQPTSPQRSPDILRLTRATITGSGWPLRSGRTLEEFVLGTGGSQGGRDRT